MSDIINAIPDPRIRTAVDFRWNPSGGKYFYADGSDSGAVKTPVSVPVTFVAEIAYPPDESVTIVSYEWDLGDGSVAFGPSVTHVFLLGRGTQRVTLCVTDSTGARACVGHQMMLTDDVVSGPLSSSLRLFDSFDFLDTDKWPTRGFGSFSPGDALSTTAGSNLLCNSSSIYGNMVSQRVFGPNVIVSVDWTVTDIQYPELYVRSSADGLTGYEAWIDTNSTAHIDRVDAGAYTPLASSAATFLDGDRIALSALGTTISLWRQTGGGWSMLTSATDTTYANAGRVGVGIGPPLFTGGLTRLDNYRVGTPS